jgi:hypothetical protein
VFPRLLPKPFGIDELLALLERAIDPTAHGEPMS